MKIERRTVLASASVGAISAAIVLALMFGPTGERIWLSALGFVAVALAVSSVVAEPREVLASLGFSLLPVMALVSEGSPAWLIGPLAVLLLVGCELNAWCWESKGSEAVGISGRGRMAAIAQLAALGLLASLPVGIAAKGAWFNATVAVAVAAIALAGLGWVLFPQRSRGGDETRSLSS